MADPTPPRGQRMDQTEASAVLIEETPQAALIGNLGTASHHLAAVEDRDRTFYLTGAMGSTTPVGLGLAMAIDDQVTVVDGDGSLLMSLGCLTTVASVDPSNLVIVVMNNASYETTGGQSSNAVEGDFAAVAEDCGIAGWTATDLASLRSAYQAATDVDGPALVDAKVEAAEPDDDEDIDFASAHTYVKHRFREEFA